jgi:hypothetical protein
MTTRRDFLARLAAGVTAFVVTPISAFTRHITTLRPVSYPFPLRGVKYELGWTRDWLRANAPRTITVDGRVRYGVVDAAALSTTPHKGVADPAIGAIASTDG